MAPRQAEDRTHPQNVARLRGMATGNSISIPEELLAAIKSAADAERRSVDAIIADAVQRYLEDRSWTRLFEYGTERATSLNLRESDVDRLISESRTEHRKH